MIKAAAIRIGSALAWLVLLLSLLTAGAFTIALLSPWRRIATLAAALWAPALLAAGVLAMQVRHQARRHAQEMRQLHRDLERTVASEAALRLANEQLEAFSYSVSHDLQAPLQRISAFAQLLQGTLHAAADAKAQHYVSRILGNADAMRQLIEGLLSLAQVSRLEMIRGTVQLSELVLEILDRLRAEQPERSVGWQVEPGLAVTADARLMRSVMENLLGNAWKFTGRKPGAQIAVGLDPEHGAYFVRDNGAGFDMAYAGRLFGTFQRLHRSDEFQGTGIGLATVAHAIVRQGGEIWAVGEPGAGATFYFTLPPAPAAPVQY